MDNTQRMVNSDDEVNLLIVGHRVKHKIEDAFQESAEFWKLFYSLK